MNVRVELGPRSYEVAIGAGVAAEIDRLDARSYALFFDSRMAPLATSIADVLGERVVMQLALEGGEAIKTAAVAADCYAALADARVDRDAVLIAVGGGSITDLAGFVAATYLRGIRWCAVPTTLLAAVDAAVGGKTAINLEAGKNLVGAFHHPAFVAIDPAAFATLDARDLAAGLAEAVKTACVADPALFAYLEANLERALARDPAVLAHVVARCVAAKAAIVAADEFERTDIRAVLNFGHTVGHALENTCGYGALRHGEAVALGMRVALALSSDLVPAVARRIGALVRAIPVPHPAVDVAAVIAATASDKKRREGKMRFVVLRDLGVPAVVDDVTEARLATAMAALA